MKLKSLVVVLVAFALVMTGLTSGAEAKPFRVAVVMPSTVNDYGWCQSLYEALVEIQKEMGKDNFEFTYSELLFMLDDADAAIRDYASQGYDLIISDHRYGVWHPQIRSELVIHQLWIRLPGYLRFLEPLLFRIHRKMLKPFDRIIVPDEAGEPNYAGLLSHPRHLPDGLRRKMEYRGIASRFLIAEYCREVPLNRIYDVVVVLSGPEPQRSVLERLLIRRLRGREWQVLVIRGLPWKKQGATVGGDIRLVSHLPPELFCAYLKKARYIIARAGYSSVMDLVALGRGAMLIPTPGQTEQEYLAEHLSEREGFVMMTQKEIREEGRKFEARCAKVEKLKG
jgi:hypothetical protein